jgi:hypothetical protein
MPKLLNRGKIAVRMVSTEMSPVGVAEVMTPGPLKSTLMGALENGANRQSGRRKKLAPRVQSAGSS